MYSNSMYKSWLPLKTMTIYVQKKWSLLNCDIEQKELIQIETLNLNKLKNYTLF